MTSSEICNICENQIALGAEYWTRGGLNYCRKCNVQYDSGMTKVEQALNAYYHHKHLSEHHWREYQRLNAIAHGWMERVAVLKAQGGSND